MRHFINQLTLRMLHYSLVYIRLQYSIIIWETANKTNLNSLKISQNKILRIILSCNIYTPEYKLYQTLRFF